MAVDTLCNKSGHLMLTRAKTGHLLPPRKLSLVFESMVKELVNVT